MFIEPNSTIKLLHNVPLDPTYEHTIFFDYVDRQTQWFNNYVKTGMVFERQSYQRHSRGYIKLEVLADNVYDCNYVMFRNTSFGNKWFYAFVTNVEYVNNNVTLIQYEIDVMQTWFFDYALGECFVEREHSDTDQVGDNIIPENVSVGDYCVAQENTIINPRFGSGSVSQWTWCIVVVAPFDKQGNSATGDTATYMYSGCKYNIFYTRNELANFFANSTVQAKADQIVNIFYAVANFVVDDLTATSPTPVAEPKKLNTNVPVYKTGLFKNNYTLADGADLENEYTPRNKKLYTYPYNFMRVTDNKGNAKDYKYEMFPSGATVAFEMTGDLSPTPSIIIAPVGYEYCFSNTSDERQNWDEAFVLDNFPQCTWNSDAFVAWLAQTGIRLGGLAIGSAATAFGAGESAFRAVDDSLTNSIGGVLASGGLAYLHGKDVRGRVNNSLSVAMNRFGAFAQNIRIRKDYARIIDDYFTMFGYACHKVKIPHRNVRDRWTYVKTRGCILAENSMPADDARKVCSIYNNGITFWTWYATVGDYTQDNPCRAEMIEP